MSNVIPIYRHDISETAEREINRWKMIAYRNQDRFTDERRDKWVLAKVAFVLGVVAGVVGTVLWI